jgi:hypothetical protein
MKVDERTRFDDGWHMIFETVLNVFEASSNGSIEVLSFFNLTISAM